MRSELGIRNAECGRTLKVGDCLTNQDTCLCVEEVRQGDAGQEVRVSYKWPVAAPASGEWYAAAALWHDGWRRAP